MKPRSDAIILMGSPYGLIPKTNGPGFWTVPIEQAPDGTWRTRTGWKPAETRPSPLASEVEALKAALRG